MPHVHHTAICASDLDRSLAFWRDGIGLDVQLDYDFDGDWPTLFGAPTDRLHSVFLGDPDKPDAGIVELVTFEEPLGDAPHPSDPPSNGFFLVSLFTDVEAALGRLGDLGLGGEPRQITVTGGVRMAVVRDPDGVLVELIDSGASDNLDQIPQEDGE